MGAGGDGPGPDDDLGVLTGPALRELAQHGPEQVPGQFGQGVAR